MRTQRLCCLVLGVLFLFTACAGQDAQTDIAEENKTSFFAMDTYVTLTAYGKDSREALSLAQGKMEALERLWSVTDENSEIYRVNHSGGTAVEVSDETAALLHFALGMADKTGGALEPTIYPVLTAWGFTTGEQRIPTEKEIEGLLAAVGYDRVKTEGNMVLLEQGMMLDLGAVGKGYAGDLAAEVLRNHNITSALLDIGGNIQAIGAKPDGTPWRLGLRDPFSGGTIGILQVTDAAVVTSGNYEKFFVGQDGETYGHLIDPASGRPAKSGLASVTVIAKEGRICDALSTALFIMGADKAVEYWNDNMDFEMILITDEGEIFVTEGIADSFIVDDAHSDMSVHMVGR
ncbi:MAG: FAD:protein FMN transferase [Lachnospiraceae bacterium]|nr:FAD:protein FMN transferase [Lachnospiraceae bacterium]